MTLPTVGGECRTRTPRSRYESQCSKGHKQAF
jgi:hypothetical protein